MTPAEYYKTYQADDEISDLSDALFDEIISYDINHVFEFGFGSGKHLKRFYNIGVDIGGIDISKLNVGKAIFGYNLSNVSLGDESYLRHVANYDCVFTCSVLDHIENITGVIDEFKRIANKAVILAETNSFDNNYYFKHDYQSYGFEKLDFEWIGEDGATYHIYKWEKS